VRSEEPLFDSEAMAETEPLEVSDPVSELDAELGPLPAALPMTSWVANKWFDGPTLRKIHQSLSKQWNRTQSINAAMKLMEKYGVKVTKEEEERLSMLEEGKQIEALVAKMPAQSADQFGQFFAELQSLVSTAAKVRQALEQGNAEACQTALDAADQSGVSQYLLKMSLVQAGSEVAHQRADYIAWAKGMDAKMSKMIRGQEDAMSAQKKLAAATATLAAFQAGQNDKAKKVIMNFASGSAKGLIASAFHGWKLAWDNEKQEKEIRAEYEERIEMIEKKLLNYRTAHLKGARGVMAKKADEIDGILKQDIFQTWKQDIWGMRTTKEEAEKLKKLESQLEAAHKAGSENTKRVIARMNGDSASALTATVFTGWVTFHKDYMKNKDLEDSVKATEQRVQAFLKSKGDSARAVLSAASSGSDTGILTEVWNAWQGFVAEIKAEAQLAELLNRGDTEFDKIMGYNKDKGQTALEKASFHIDQMYFTRFFNFWKLESKQQTIQQKYHKKIDGKRRQLQGVQEMFRKFANELEAGLKQGSETIGGTRDWRAGHPKMTKSDASVSLPDINQKVGPGSGRSGKTSAAIYPAQGAYPQGLA
jgi:hypothetical protein